MKIFLIIYILVAFGCSAAKTTSPGPEVILTEEMAAEIIKKANDPESLEHCMRYDENIVLTVKEELELLDYCLGNKFD